MKLTSHVASKFFKHNSNSPFVRIRRTFNRVFRKYLLLANITISATLSATGDAIEQKYEIYNGDETSYDLRRTAIMGASGISTGFISHYWYQLLDKAIPGATLRIAFKKMLLDLLISSPLTIVGLLGTVSILEGRSVNDFYKDVRCKAWKLYVADWIVWPPAQMINYYFLPLRYRVLYDNSISLCYDIYTSRIKYDVVDCD